MPRKASLLNVREYIKFTVQMAEAFDRWGDCPLIREEMIRVKLLGNAIIRKSDEKRKAGNRHDIYVGEE